MTTHAGVLPEDKTDPAYQILLGSVGEIAEHGAGVGVYFAMETGQESPQALGDFIDEVNNPWLKVNYDPCNLLKYGTEAGTVQGVYSLGDKIIHTHAKDWNPDNAASHLRRRACALGRLICRRCEISAMKAYLAIEDETGNDDMIGSISRSYAFLRGYLND